jgi:hypothetical protein
MGTPVDTESGPGEREGPAISLGSLQETRCCFTKVERIAADQSTRRASKRRPTEWLTPWALILVKSCSSAWCVPKVLARPLSERKVP